MKKIILIVLFSIIAVFEGLGHKINGYKYIVINQQGDTYGIESKLEKAFTKIGFSVIQDVDDLEENEKAYVLYATYAAYIHYGYPSELTVILRDVSGIDIFKSTTSGNAIMASGDMSIAVNKLLKNMRRLNYSFDGTIVNTASYVYDIPCRTWSEDSIKIYLNKRPVSSIEGIYKNFSNDASFYRFAIIKQQGKYYGVIMESGNSGWKKGDIKMTLSHIEKKLYDVEYFDTKRKKFNCVAGYSDRILEIDTNGNQFKFLKTYPSTSMSEASSAAIPSDCKATGSGILVSGRFIITNNHVVEGAEKIEVSLNNNAASESYNARVLTVDKSNDLAILVIKDAKYKELPEAPFGISRESLSEGTPIFTMGYPLSDILGAEVKVTDGIISSKSGYQGDASLYQISAPIQPGNSGGGLFDKEGNLVGITNAGIPSAENVGYAIKSLYLYNLIDSSPIEITIPKGKDVSKDDLPTLVKRIKPYIAIVKVY